MSVPRRKGGGFMTQKPRMLTTQQYAEVRDGHMVVVATYQSTFSDDRPTISYLRSKVFISGIYLEQIILSCGVGASGPAKRHVAQPTTYMTRQTNLDSLCGWYT